MTTVERGAAALAAGARASGSEPVRALVAGHLGVVDDVLDDLPVVTASFERWRQIAVQAALDALLAVVGEAGRVGVPLSAHVVPSLAEVLLRTGADLGPVEYVNRPSGPLESMPCLNRGFVLTWWQRMPVVLWLRPLWDQLDNSARIAIEAKAVDLATGPAFLADLRQRIAATSPYRGQSLRLVLDRAGGIADIEFEPKPTVTRDHVVLPDAVFAAIESHAVGVGKAAERLRAAGQHLKRGLLLHGPPGTGKTHTIRYLTSRLPDATLFVLTGGALGQVKQITALLEELAPAIIVLDDIDLIAQDRSRAENSGAVLFDLLDAMDGLREDVDLLFICTSNRAEVLEAAIAARPGRIDQAVEVGVPGDDARRQLLELYGAGLDLQIDDLDALLRRTDGVTASFMKELLRRACIVSLGERRAAGGLTSGPPLLTDAHLHRALDVLLDPDLPLTPALLGIHGAAAANRTERGLARGPGQDWCGI